MTESEANTTANFVDMILFYANATPEKPAILMTDRIVTYRMMAAGIRSVESVLRDKHLTPGQIVAVKIDSPARHVIVTCALYRLGIVSISVRPKMNVSQAGVALDAMITDGGSVSWTGTTYVASDDWFVQEPGRAGGAGNGFANPDALCRIVFSSGTTAIPRAIGISTWVLENRIKTHNCALSVAPWDRMLILPPLTSSLVQTAALALAFGRTIIFAFSSLETMQLINLFAADLLVANPQHLKEMVATHRTNPIPTPSLKLIKFGSDAASPAIVSEARARFCENIVGVFATAEDGPIAFAPADRLLDVPGVAGYLAPWAEIEAIDENGNRLPAGSAGILRVRTKAQGVDILQPPTSHAEPQWHYCGDYGKLLPDGMVVLSGHVSDMIKLPGKLISPEPVEQVLASYPGVGEAAALGRLSTSGRHEFWIAIKANGHINIEDVKKFLLSRNPDWITTGVRLVDAMPRNELGKLVRQVLREQLPAA